MKDLHHWEHHPEFNLKQFLAYIIFFSMIIGCAVYSSPSQKHREIIKNNSK